jgi:hypothetical protein
VTTIQESNPRSVDETIDLAAADHVRGDQDDPRLPAPPESRRLLTRLGWLFAALAVAGSVMLAVVVLREPSNTSQLVTDAKDHPRYGSVSAVPVVERVVTDAKDHPRYGSVSAVPVVERVVTDAKDHPRYGSNPLVPVVEPAE